MNFFKQSSISWAILALIGCSVFFIINLKTNVNAQNQIKVYPTSYSVEVSGDITWQNPTNAFTQDLADNASLSDFNEENSTFIQEKPKKETTTTTITTVTSATSTTTESTTTTTILEETTTTAIQQSTTTTTESTTTTTIESTATTTLPEESTTTTEPISFLKKIFGFLVLNVNAEEEKNQPIISSASLTFENFSLPEDFDLNEVQNVQLRFSLAGIGKKGDRLIIKYFYNNEWQNLGELDLSQEVSNNKNGGYFLYALPIFENQEDLQNLKIKFQVSGSEFIEVYLDSVWLEIDYGENLQKTSLINMTENNYSKLPIHQKTKLSREIKINKNSEQFCLVKPFQTILSQGETKSVVILLNKKTNSYEEVILGDLPLGIKAYFTDNNDSKISGNNLSNQLLLYLEADIESQKGSFNVPIIFGIQNNDFSDTVCQFNLIVK